MEPEIEAVLEKGEKISWEGKQEIKSALVSSLFIVLFLFAFGYVFLWVSQSSTGTCYVNNQPAPPESCQGTFTYVAYGMFGLSFFIILASYINYRVTRYLITSKRVLIKTGWIGADIRSVYYNQIRTAFVDVGIIGKLFGTGHIKMDTGRIVSAGKNGSRTDFDHFSHIREPYFVIKLIREHLSEREEGLSSGRKDYEENTPEYKKFIQETEKMKKEVK